MKRLLLSLMILAWGCEPGSGTTTDPQPNAMQPGNPMNPNSPAAPEMMPGAQQPSAPGTPDERNDNAQTPAPEAPAAEPTETNWGPSRDVDLRRAQVIEPPGRARRRMNLDQLESAILRVSDGLNWTERRGNNEVRLFQELSTTLGKPDFIQVTTEVLEPTALFQKFLGDAARQICDKMVQRDLESRGERRLVLEASDSESLDAHLRSLVLRFHQRHLAEDSRDLAQWRWLFDSVVRMTDTTEQRWNAVCVALFTHPDFYTY